MSSCASSSVQTTRRCQDIGKSRSNTVFGCLELAFKISALTPEIVPTQKVLYQSSYKASLLEFSSIIGPSKYDNIVTQAISDIKRKPTFNQTTVSDSLAAKRIFVNLFKTIKKLNGNSFLETLFPRADLRSIASVIDYCIYPQILEQMHIWIEDTNLIIMARNIDGVDENLKTPLANNSLEATHQRAEAIRAWLHGHHNFTEHVTQLFLFNLGLTSIPPEINLFTNLVLLNLSNNQITQIHPSTFLALVNLERLNLSHNQIVQIHPNIFSANVNLQILTLSHNKIVQVHDDVFSPLVQLWDLNLYNNEIAQIHPNAFSALVKLLYLNLSNNNIVQIHPNVFSTLVNLRSLAIDDINVDFLPDMSAFSEDVVDTLLSHLHVIPSSSSSASAASTSMSSSASAPSSFSLAPISSSELASSSALASSTFSSSFAYPAYQEESAASVSSSQSHSSSSASIQARDQNSPVLKRVSVSQGIENMAHVGLWSRISNFFTSILGRMLGNCPCG